MPLAYLVNKCLSSRKFPDRLKLTCVEPLYRKFESTDVPSYRPIASSSAFSKVFENAMLEILNDFLSKHDILSDAQHAFRKNRF